MTALIDRIKYEDRSDNSIGMRRYSIFDDDGTYLGWVVKWDHDREWTAFVTADVNYTTRGYATRRSPPMRSSGSGGPAARLSRRSPPGWRSPPSIPSTSPPPLPTRCEEGNGTMTDLGPDSRTEADYARAASNQYEIERRREVEQTARELTAEWNAALAAYRRDSRPFAYDAEQKAYDALVDFVEENGLNYSEFDPRGPEEAQQP